MKKRRVVMPVTKQALLPVITERLKPFFDDLRGAGISEEEAATILGQASVSILDDVMSRFLETSVTEDELNQVISDPENAYRHLADLFEKHMHQDLDSYVKQKTDAFYEEFKHS